MTLSQALVSRNDTKTRATKEKIDKFDFLEFKNFCAGHDSIKKVKRQSKEWEEKLASHISNKGFISRRYKEFQPLVFIYKYTQNYFTTIIKGKYPF